MRRRILVLHSRYLSGPLSGENRVVDDEVRLLREAGHEVWIHDPAPRVATAGQTIRTGAGALWSRRAVGTVRHLVARHAIEVVHAHNLVPALSPAVLREAARAGAAPVMTLHNYRLMCIAGTLVRDGRQCELCVGRSPIPGVRYRCYRGSAGGSVAVAASLSLHRSIGSFDRVKLFLPVSRYLADKHIEGGFPPERMRVKPNFAWPTPVRADAGDAFVYLGRLSPEKGIANLVKAWSGPPRLIVVGDGPDAGPIRAAAGPHVETRPPAPPEGVPAILAGARALLLPSIAPEAAPRILVEAAAAGVPMIASAVGGVSEIVDHERSGLLVPAGDPEAMIHAARRLTDDSEALRLGAGAREAWRERFAPQGNLAALERAYSEARTA